MNPLERKRTAAVIDQPVTAAMVSTVKVPRDHIYCKLERTVGQSTLRFGAGHTTDIDTFTHMPVVTVCSVMVSCLLL